MELGQLLDHPSFSHRMLVSEVASVLQGIDEGTEGARRATKIACQWNGIHSYFFAAVFAGCAPAF
jgi:hypothetical protein